MRRVLAFSQLIEPIYLTFVRLRQLNSVTNIVITQLASRFHGAAHNADAV